MAMHGSLAQYLVVVVRGGTRQMTKFSPNPLKWLKQKQWRKAAKTAGAPPGLLKSAATPRKSGDIFLHLITIQKSLKSMELAMRQQIDFTWLIQKITAQISILKLESETIGEEELAAVAGQVEAYFETISEDRLDFDEKGLAVMLEFTNIYKDAFADAVSNPPEVDQDRLKGWNKCYQALMAEMRPGYGDSPLEAAEIVEDPAEVAQDQMAAAQADEIVESRPVLELTDEDAGIEPEEPEPPEAIEDAAKKPEAASTDVGDFGELEEEVPEEEVPEGAAAQERKQEADEAAVFESAPPEDEVDMLDEVESPEEPWASDDDIPLYDPSEEIRVRDVVISDAEIKSAREYMELGESTPEVRRPAEGAHVESDELSGVDRPEPVTTGSRFGRRKTDRSPVQLQEVERLKSKLSELHEKQEMLSTRMSNILGDYNKAVRTEAVAGDRSSIEDFDIEDLEEIIFIGRGKG